MHGSMPPFDVDSEDWRSYVERLNNYFKANKVDDADQKTAILLTVCGSKAYSLIRSLVTGNPSSEEYDSLVEIITKHFSPKPSSIIQRFKFNTRVRGHNESIADYVAALRGLTKFCEFKAETLNDMLRDRLVCGVSDERMQRRLLAESDLTFEKALHLAQAIESADKDTKDLKSTRDPPHQPLHYQRHNPRKTQPKSVVPKPSLVCTRCGNAHKAPECPFKEAICRFCKKKGHFAKMCRAKQTQKWGSQNHKGTHYIEEKMSTTVEKERVQ